jgi:membrane protease YdiL (CAAX protease family)
VLGTPPLLAAIAAGRIPIGDHATTLRQMLYGVVWLLPAMAVAAGWGLGRDWRAVTERLGLVRPTRGQLLIAPALAVGLVGAAHLVDLGTTQVWAAMGWARTDGELVNRLLGFALTPVGALVTGVTAGLGEELVMRGLLQPRVGLLLANLVFTSVNGLQYGWDGVIQVFLIGLAFGLIRRRTNTTTSALAHGVFDVVAIGWAMYLGAGG